VGFAAAGNHDDALNDEPLSRVETTDFIEYGFEPEFVGRLPVRVACHHLASEDLEDILLQSEGSILRQYQTEFDGYGVEFSLQPGAVTKISEMAHEQKTGARGLMTVLERVFRDFKFELPSTSIRKFEVTPETIAKPGEHLKAMLKENGAAQRKLLATEVKTFARRFKEEHGFELKFRSEAVEILVEESIESDTTIRALCDRKFHDFHYGLTLISRNTGKSVFTITRSTIENADKELSRWVADSFKDLRSEP